MFFSSTILIEVPNKVDKNFTVLTTEVNFVTFVLQTINKQLSKTDK